MNYEILPEGTYTGCSIPFPSGEQIIYGESSQKGTPYARVNLGVTDGDKAGKSIYHDLYMTEKTIEKTVRALRALGFVGESFEDFIGQKPSAEVEFEIVHEEYNSRVRAKVNRIGKPQKKLTSDELGALSDKYSGLLTATAPPEDSGNPDDELKF